MAWLSAVYNGSRSMRAGTWLDLDIFDTLGSDCFSVFGGSIGALVLRESDAGSMSGMVKAVREAAYTARLAGESRAHRKRNARRV